MSEHGEAHDRHVDELHQMLKRDKASLSPRYPDQAAFALQDTDVHQSVTGRLASGHRLMGIESLPYDFDSGLNKIVFRFARSDPIELEADAILVVLDSHNGVVGLVDPFSPDRPNHVMPELPSSDVPLVLARPSAAEAVPDEVVAAQADRTHEFLARVGVNATAAPGAPGGGPSENPTVNTRSWGYCLHYGMPELKCQPTGIFGMKCTQVQEVKRVLDQVWDDCSDIV